MSANTTGPRATAGKASTFTTHLASAGTRRWVDDSVTLLILEGQSMGGKMVLEGADHRKRRPGGPAPESRGRPVRTEASASLWESTDAQGAWTIALDDEYTNSKRWTVSCPAVTTGGQNSTKDV